MNIEQIKRLLFGNLYLALKWKQIENEGLKNYAMLPSEGSEIDQDVWEEITSHNHKGFDKAFTLSSVDADIDSNEKRQFFLKKFNTELLLEFKRTYKENEGFYFCSLLRNGGSEDTPDFVLISEKIYRKSSAIVAYDVDWSQFSREECRISLRSKVYGMGNKLWGKLRVIFSFLFSIVLPIILYLYVPILMLLSDGAFDNGFFSAMGTVVFYFGYASIIQGFFIFANYKVRDNIAPHQSFHLNPENSSDPFIQKDVEKMKRVFQRVCNTTFTGASSATDVPRVGHIDVAGSPESG